MGKWDHRLFWWDIYANIFSHLVSVSFHTGHLIITIIFFLAHSWFPRPSFLGLLSFRDHQMAKTEIQFFQQKLLKGTPWLLWATTTTKSPAALEAVWTECVSVRTYIFFLVKFRASSSVTNLQQVDNRQHIQSKFHLKLCGFGEVTSVCLRVLVIVRREWTWGTI